MDINTATIFATKAHAGQYDKLGIPYIEHPKAVARILISSPAFLRLSSPEKHTAILTALLHDVIEDTHYTREDLLRLGFDEETLYNVELLTYISSDGDRMSYYEKIKPNPIARAVKIADIIHNNLDSRVKELDYETRNRLVIKYGKAKDVLFTPEDLHYFDSTIVE